VCVCVVWVCSPLSSGGRWRASSAWALLRDAVSRDGPNAGYFLSRNQVLVCPLRAPIVEKSETASYDTVSIEPNPNSQTALVPINFTKLTFFIRRSHFCAMGFGVGRAVCRGTGSGTKD
jgi:hypothetical protein